MEILSITVAGFRNLRTTKVRLCDRIVSLVSPNNYGKSNLLDAVAFGIRFMSSSPRARMGMMGDVGSMPLVPELAIDDYAFEMELHEPGLGTYQYVRYGFSFSWRRDDGTGGRITQERIELGLTRTGVWPSYLKRDTGRYRPSRLVSRCTRKLALDDDQLAIDVLTAIDGIEIGPAIRTIRQMSYGACHPLSADRVMYDHPLELKTREVGVFALTDADLPHSLFELKRVHPDKYAAFQRIVCGLFPEITSIDVASSQPQPEQGQRIEGQTRYFQDVRTADASGQIPYRIRDEVYRIYVTSRHLNQPVDVARMSKATRRVIWLIAYSVMAEVAGIGCLGVDEMETGIHPSLMQELLEAIREALGTTKMILTSQSPHLIQCLPINCLYLGVPNDRGNASFATIKAENADALADAAYDRGMSVGEHLFALMSPGEDEEDVLKGYLGES